MQSKVKILPPKQNAHYVEESQTKKIFMCYAEKLEKNVFQKLHAMVICRDYFGDALHAEQSNTDVSIFGFSWGPTRGLKLDRDKTRLCFKGERDQDLVDFKKNLSILNKIEKNNGLEETSFLEGEGNKSNWEIIIEGDSKWMSSIFLISLYTFLLKCMCYEIEDKEKWVQNIIDHGSKESFYIKGYKDLFVKVLDNLPRFGYDKKSKDVKVHGLEADNVYNGTIHNSSGFVTLISTPFKKNYYSEVVSELRKEVA